MLRPHIGRKSLFNARSRYPVVHEIAFALAMLPKSALSIREKTMAAIHLSGSRFASLALLACTFLALGMGTGTAIAQVCNSGNAGNSLTGANCQATATGAGAVAIGSTATTGANGDAIAVGFNAQAGD